MDKTYWERVQRDEARRAEWRLLDHALATRGDHRSVRVRLGYMLIRAGATLAHITVTVQPEPCCTNAIR